MHVLFNALMVVVVVAVFVLLPNARPIAVWAIHAAEDIIFCFLFNAYNIVKWVPTAVV